MKKILLALLAFVLLSAPVDIYAQRRKSSSPPKVSQQSVRAKQQKTRREIQKTAKDIEKNRRDVENKLNALNRVTADIEVLDGQIGSVRNEIAVLDARIKSVSDSIAEIDSRMSALSAKYGTAVRKISSRNRNAVSDLAFIFSANTVAEAYRRSRSLKQFSNYRARKSRELTELKELLAQRQASLSSLKDKRAGKLSALEISKSELGRRQEQNRSLVAALQKEGKTLKGIMERKQKEAASLEAELNRLIALEQARLEKERKEKERLERERLEKERLEKERIEKERAEKERIASEKAEKERSSKEKKNSRKDSKKENKKQPVTPDSHSKPMRQTDSPVKDTQASAVKKAQSGSKSQNRQSSVSGKDFAELRGCLSAPVRGNYTVVKRFGRQKHPDLRYVETDNPGIDMETSPNAVAIAVADGYISDIFRLPGYNNVVMVRHGNYLTVYANLVTISVRKGDKVTAGSAIGTVYSDPEDEGRSILHFEIRKEKVKENPEIWIAGMKMKTDMSA